MRAASILIATVALVACAGTTLETPSDHPANPAARQTLAQNAAAALKPGFDPFEAYPDEAADEEPESAPHHHGGHGAHEAPAGSQSTPPGAADHSAHSPGGKGPSSAASPDAAPSFTCPMHSEVVRSAPGSCPKCGMNLVPKKPEPAHPDH